MVHCRFYRTCEKYWEGKSLCDDKSNLVRCDYYKEFKKFIKSMRVKPAGELSNDF